MRKVLFISLGCDKNLVDSEIMLGILDGKGWQIVDDEAQADVIVINTCCFIHDAMEESIQNILEMAEYRKSGQAKALIVAGCLAQRYRQEILDEILSGLSLDGCRVCAVSLICEEEELTKRLRKDVEAGLREADVIGRSAARIGLYEKLSTIKVDVTHLTPGETAEGILAAAGMKE